jgi:hypothetical protein
MDTKSIVQRIKDDEAKLARYSRAFLAWVAGLALQVVSVGADTVATWTPRRWAIGFLVAAIMGVAGLISVGQKNPTSPAP